MTDNEIIKALECCSKAISDCENCPAGGICDTDSYCVTGAILDLINRQKAEISALTSAVDSSTQEFLKLHDEYQEQKAEIERLEAQHREMCIGIKVLKKKAIKEFAERLKESAFDCDVSFGYGREHYEKAVAVIQIDNLVKEMTEASQ